MIELALRDWSTGRGATREQTRSIIIHSAVALTAARGYGPSMPLSRRNHVANRAQGTDERMRSASGAAKGYRNRDRQARSRAASELPGSQSTCSHSITKDQRAESDADTCDELADQVHVAPNHRAPHFEPTAPARGATQGNYCRQKQRRGAQQAARSLGRRARVVADNELAAARVRVRKSELVCPPHSELVRSEHHGWAKGTVATT
jgi:hypothetical protein